jgi:hypothetical protein
MKIKKEFQSIIDFAKGKGYKVYTFLTDGSIEQVYVENPKIQGKLVSIWWSFNTQEILISTEQKPSQNNGSGYTLCTYSQKNLFDLMEGITNFQNPNPYKDFNEKMKREKVIKFVEI